MGAVNFSLDERLVVSLKEVLPLTTFVETGTYKGDSIASMLPCFDKLVSIESSEELWKYASARFSKENNVKLIHGSSAEMITDVSIALSNESTLYWLDAHWCVAHNTAGEQSQCPLIQELEGIGQLNEHSVILIDDARLFLAPPPEPHNINQWPLFDEIVKNLHKLSLKHEIMIINDVIIFFPSSARAAIVRYGRQHGVDWLHAMQSFLEVNSLKLDLETKEDFLQDLVAQLQAKEQLSLKNRIIKHIPGVRKIIQCRRYLIEKFRPRLGNLNQYPPRPLSVVSPPLSHNSNTSLKISIVTPSYLQGDYIESTIQSVLNQGYSNIEYYVQDGGSNDHTIKILKKYNSRLSGWASESDNGQSQAINRGFSHATGDIMAWINSDDLLLPGALAVVSDYFNRHPDVDVVYGNRLLIDKNDMEIGRWVLPGHSAAVLSWADYIPQETLFWRRDIWNKVGGHIDESFRFAMDWDLLIRFREAGARFAHIPRFLGAFRIHDLQKTSKSMNEIGAKEMDIIRERVLGYVPSNKKIRQKVLPFLLWHLAVILTFGLNARLNRPKP